jgi:hypothetical protein
MNQQSSIETLLRANAMEMKAKMAKCENIEKTSTRRRMKQVR